MSKHKENDLTQFLIVKEDNGGDPDLNVTILNNISGSSSEKYLIYGHMLNLISILLYFLSNVFAKLQYLYLPSITINLSQLYRSIFILLFAIIHIIISRKKLDFSENRRNWQYFIANAIFTNTIYIFYFITCYYLRLGTAYTLLYTYPIFTSILSYIFLKEEIHSIDLIGLVVGIASILMITKAFSPEVAFDNKQLLNVSNTSTFTTIVGVTFGILGSLSIAGKLIFFKKMANIKLNPHFSLFWSAFMGIVVSTIGMVIYSEEIVIKVDVLIISFILGVTVYYANYSLFLSLKHITLVETLPQSFVTIIFSFLAGLAFFNNAIGWLDIFASSLLIMFSYYYIQDKLNHPTRTTID